MNLSTLSRRRALQLLAVLPLTVGTTDAATTKSGFEKAMHALEKRSGARIGLAVLDTGSAARLSWREHERFAMCSTFKLPLAAYTLARVEQGKEQLDRLIHYQSSDLLEWAPITREHISAGSMRVDALCEAAITHSDNTAANLLLAAGGGLAALTAWLRSIGDKITRLDRIEPELNSAIPGDPRDTTTPAAMLTTLQRLLLGNALTEVSRVQLQQWLIANTTGTDKLRAGLPAGWRVGDKTGSGAHGASNDLAIIWPPDRAPLLIAAYTVGSSLPTEQRSAVLADLARLALASL